MRDLEMSSGIRSRQYGGGGGEAVMGGPTVTLQNGGTVVYYIIDGLFTPLIPLRSFRLFRSFFIGLNII